MSPGAPVVDTTRPLTGEGTSTAAFSVITSTITSSSADAIARLDPPADDLSLDRALTEIRKLEDVPAHAASMTWRSAAAMRACPGKYSHSNACG